MSEREEQATNNQKDFLPEANLAANDHEEVKIPRKLAALISTQSMYAGPIPPPEVLAKYKEVMPDAPNRILKMAERQAEHRMYLEKTTIEGDLKRANLGLITGILTVLASVSAGLISILTGHDVAGLGVIGVDAVALAGVFVYGSTNRKNERIEKTKILAKQDEKE